MRADAASTPRGADVGGAIPCRIPGGRARGACLDAGTSDPVRGDAAEAPHVRGRSGVDPAHPASLPRVARVRPPARASAAVPGAAVSGAGHDAVPPDAGPVALVRLAGEAASRDAVWGRSGFDSVAVETRKRRTGRHGPGAAPVPERPDDGPTGRHVAQPPRRRGRSRRRPIRSPAASASPSTGSKTRRPKADRHKSIPAHMMGDA